MTTLPTRVIDPDSRHGRAVRVCLSGGVLCYEVVGADNIIRVFPVADCKPWYDETTAYKQFLKGEPVT